MTAEDIDKISLMRDEGKTTKEIATEFGVSYKTMTNWINRLIKEGEIGKLTARVRWTEELVSELILMKGSGATIEEMTKRLGVSFGAMHEKVTALVRAEKLPREFSHWKQNGLYEYLDAHNLCHRCYRKEKISGYSFCSACIERDFFQRIMRPSQKQGERLRKKREEHKKNGICIDCSKPATHGLYCYEHMIARKKAGLRHGEKRRRERMGIPTVLDIRKANRLCLRCGSPIEDGNSTFWCNACRERQSRNATITNARMKEAGQGFYFWRLRYELQTQKQRGF